MRILLMIEKPKKENFYLTRLQPLGVLYIASFLESKGIKVDVIDRNVDGRRPDYGDYDLVGFSASAGNIEGTVEQAIACRRLGKKVVVGGPITALSADHVLDACKADAVMAGESESILYDYIKSGNSAKGIYFKEGARTRYSGDKKPCEDLDSLPFPDLRKVPYARYRSVISKRKPIASIITSRGCPHGCTFCSHTLGFRYRMRSPENVIREMRQDKNLGIKELWVGDDNFTHDIERCERICDLMVEQGLDLTYTLQNGIRADRITSRLAGKLRKSGCYLVTLSPETGSDSSLAKIKKGFSKDHVRKAVRILKENRLFVMCNFIMGFPWEDRPDLEETIEFAASLDADMYHFMRLIPYPNTPIWDEIRKERYAFKDEGPNFGGFRYDHPTITEKDLRQLIKKAYYRTMLNPVRLARLAGLIGVNSMKDLARYAVETSNI